MTTYTFAQLEGLWIQAGGSKALAPLMAGVAEVESGGNPQAYNPSGASGLWQIEIPVNESYVPGGAANVFNALDNAKAAVALSGNTLAGITANWLDFEPPGAAEAIAADKHPEAVAFDRAMESDIMAVLDHGIHRPGVINEAKRERMRQIVAFYFGDTKSGRALVPDVRDCFKALVEPL